MEKSSKSIIYMIIGVVAIAVIAVTAAYGLFNLKRFSEYSLNYVVSIAACVLSAIGMIRYQKKLLSIGFLLFAIALLLRLFRIFNLPTRFWGNWLSGGYQAFFGFIAFLILFLITIRNSLAEKTWWNISILFILLANGSKIVNLQSYNLLSVLESAAVILVVIFSGLLFFVSNTFNEQPRLTDTKINDIPSHSDNLAKLKELLDNGTITEEEYERKKRILGL